MDNRIEGRIWARRIPLSAVEVIAALALLAAAMFSATVLADKYSSPDAYKHEIEQLDNRKSVTASMSVAAAIASAGASFIPDDTCTPIAQQLAEISKDLGLVTGAIILEKYAMTILGAALFRWILPCALVLGAACAIAPGSFVIKAPIVAAVGRVLLASFLVWYSVPLGVRMSDMILATYETTINDAIADAELASELAQQDAEQSDGDEEPAEDSGISLDNISIEMFVDAISGISSTVAGKLNSAARSAEYKVEVLVAWAKAVLTQLTEGFAVLVVTTCVIPALVPLFMFWLVKLFFQPSSWMQLVGQVPMLRLEGDRD